MTKKIEDGVRGKLDEIIARGGSIMPLWTTSTTIVKTGINPTDVSIEFWKTVYTVIKESYMQYIR